MAKVLIIDDSPMMRTYVSHCLEKAGFDVESWMPESAMEIPGKLSASKPSLIIADYRMPGCNGATLARMARTADPATPVVILTSFRDEEIEASLLKLGVKRILYKPIRGEDLASVATELTQT